MTNETVLVPIVWENFDILQPDPDWGKVDFTLGDEEAVLTVRATRTRTGAIRLQVWRGTGSNIIIDLDPDTTDRSLETHLIDGVGPRKEE